MRWLGGGSGNIEDRRGGRGGMALGGFGIVAVILGLLFGEDATRFLGLIPGMDPSAQTAPARTGTPEDAGGRFVNNVLASTDEVWTNLFRENGAEYQEPTLVLFDGQTQSGCGFASAATGPFYCPADQKVYIDLSFYDELQNRFGAPGDFAQAYVIAHEVGHHVQDLMGTTRKVDEMRGRLSETEYNKLSVRLELQADFYAGVWAHHGRDKQFVLDEGDIEEALNAASAIGDDRLQQQSQGHVVPDAFTHGTSAQRVRWFRKGFETGDLRQGDTFSAPSL
ncbi:MAG TPA: neutral zinc metallopeptidase [Sphingobacteriaceae bacterium]